MELQRALKALFELLDFIFKATAAYLETPEGKDEWGQWFSAFEEALNRDIDGDGVVGRPAAGAESAAPTVRRVVKE